MKIIKGAVKLVLKRKVETDEWLVIYYENGKRDEGKTYYTNDKKDAMDSLNFMAARLSE